MFKKLLSVCLVLLVLLSVFTCALTVTAEEENNNTGTTTIMTGVITLENSNQANLRADAGTGDVQIVASLSNGSFLSVLGTKNDINNNINPKTQSVFIWYNVQYFGDKTYTGYIREDLITVTTHTITPPDQNIKPFEEQLAEFPESYHPYLRELHKLYPNWIFTADNIDLTYQKAIALENVFPQKLVDNNYFSWRSMEFGAFDWNTGSYVVTDGRWFGASREVIAYYMDPRNFLNPNDAYIFMKQSYDPNSQNVEGVRELLKGRFMETNYNDPNDTAYGGDYAVVIMAAAQQSGVNPYILASTIIQEQGTNGSIFSNGNLSYEGVPVYNFFNFGVNGTTEDDKRNNGSKYAYNAGWTTRSASIIGGAKKYADGYVNSSPENPYYNQDTYFYKNYNILNPNKIYHQYAQNVADQVSSAAILRKLYASNVTTYLTFRIPVYKDNSLPETPFVKPEKNNNKNNYYFNAIEVEGLTPSFSRYTYTYGLQVDKDTSVYFAVPANVYLLTPMTYNLTTGDNRIVLTVRSETGYTNDYVINVNALTDCVLTLTSTKTPTAPPEQEGGGTTTDPDNPGGENGGEGVNPEDTPPAPTIKRGDVNGDGNITVSDLAAIRLHMLELAILTEDKLLAADTNGDSKISVSDLAAIRLHMLGLVELK
ncbi:MAG: hypothetical protein J6C27_07540 [Clostridia bacterium]|nr:hypothetical protein [Clostridia bacterium]